jgi:UDP-glucose 4-epimerase
MHTVLVNGIGTLLGSRIAHRLSDTAGVRLVGMGVVGQHPSPAAVTLLPPVQERRQMVDVLRDAQVTTVIHLDIAGEEYPAPDREAALQQNVLDSMGLLGACAAAGVQRVVIRSSTLVYGATPQTPVFVREDYPVAARLHTSLLRDFGEVERFAASFAQKHTHVDVSILRCAGLVGGGAWSPLAQYFAQAAPAMVLGFNPRIQLLHPDDATEAFVLATTADVCGAFNIASEGVLTLEHAIRLTGRQPVVVPDGVMDIALRLGVGRALSGGWPYDRDFLRYGCVADTGRAAGVLGWQASNTAEAIVRAMNPIPPHTNQSAEEKGTEEKGTNDGDPNRADA